MMACGSLLLMESAGSGNTSEDFQFTVDEEVIALNECHRSTAALDS